MLLNNVIPKFVAFFVIDGMAFSISSYIRLVESLQNLLFSVVLSRGNFASRDKFFSLATLGAIIFHNYSILGQTTVYELITRIYYFSEPIRTLETQYPRLKS